MAAPTRHARRLFVLLLAGCGTLGGGGGGGENLPNRGLRPYVRFAGAAAEGFVLTGAVSGPAALVRDGRVLLFYADRGADQTRIRVAEADLAGERFGEPRDVFGDRPASIGTRPADPFAWVEGDAIHLVVVADGGAIEHFTSPDGVSFSDAGTWLPADAAEGPMGSPSVVLDGAGAELYYSTQDGLHFAEAGADRSFRRRGRVLPLGADCRAPNGDAVDCFDAEGVDDPEVRRSLSAIERPILRVVYSGRSGSNRAIGFAAADAGGAFERFVENPIYDDRKSAERAPTNVLAGDRYLMYVVETRNGTTGVSLLVDEAGEPSERF